MAAPTALGGPVVRTHQTFLEFYDHPPLSNTTTINPGSSSTAPIAPPEPPDPRKLPRLIRGEQHMCHAIIHDARETLTNCNSPLQGLPLYHAVTEGNLGSHTGDENSNLDMFKTVADYIARFVEAADRLPCYTVQSTTCQNHGGVRANRKIQRAGVDRIIVEQKSVAAFDRHSVDIQDLAHANGGQGTEILFQSYAAGAESIVLKVSQHNNIPSCVWRWTMNADMNIFDTI